MKFNKRKCKAQPLGKKTQPTLAHGRGHSGGKQLGRKGPEVLVNKKLNLSQNVP